MIGNIYFTNETSLFGSKILSSLVKKTETFSKVLGVIPNYCEAA
jgi:hypothetical protein